MIFKFLSKALSNESQIIELKKELESNQKANYFNLESGNNNFNLILGGGFRSSKSYVIYGENSTGKTQLCHQICIQAFKSAIKTIYLDTENTFRPERIKELCLYQNLNEIDVLKNILIAKVITGEGLKVKVKELEDIIKNSKYKLIIIDTINNYYRLEQSILDDQPRKDFRNTLNTLNELVKKFNQILIVTAQVTPRFTDSSIIKHYPVGVQYLNHFFTEFIYLSKINDKYVVRLTNSSFLNETRLPYQITSKGISDI